MRVVELDIDAPFGETRDVAVELLADVLLHELDHLVLDRGAFGLGGDDFAVRGPDAQLLDGLLFDRLAALQVVGQQPVDHHVGIAADGRGEVRVVGECQTVVADVVGRVVGLGHRTHGHRRDGILFGRALDLLEQLVHLLGHGAALRGLEDVAEAEDELPEAVEFLLARGVVYAEDHRAGHGPTLFVAAVGAELRHAAVGQQHELLDHLVRLLLLLEVDAQRFAVFVEFEFHLLTFERDGAVLEAACAQGLGQAVEREDLLGEVAAAGLDHLLGLGVGEATVGVDDRAAEPLVEDLEILVHREDGREAEACLVGAQRAEFVREAFGEHRYGAVHQIDRRAAFDGFVIDHRVGLDVVGDVGDVDADLPDAVAHLADREGVVEVLGVGRVDREGHHLAEVAPPGDFVGRDAAVDGLGGLFDLGFEAVREFVFGQDGVHFGVVVAGDAEPLDQFADGALAAGLPVDDAHDDLFAVVHLRVVAFREVDVHRHAARIGLDEDLVGAHLGHADIGFARAFDDAGDLALEAVVAAAVDDGHLDAVAVQGIGRVAGVDEDVLVEPLDLDVDRSRLGHAGHTFVVGPVLLREAVLFARALLDDPFVEEPPEDFERFAPALLRGASRDRGEVFERELGVGEVAEHVENDLLATGSSGAFRGLLLSLVHIVCLTFRGSGAPACA